jgi:hypothetical protein
MILVLLILSQINTSGYVETRPYVTWNDSTNILGYNRGWLEFKSEGMNYGTQLVLDLIVPYDTFTISYTLENVNISRLALWLGPEEIRVVVGKQSLYWGVGRVFRPLDNVHETNYFEPGYERAGTNALMGYLSLGSLTNARAIIIPHGEIARTMTGIRAGTNIINNDVGFTAMHRSEERQTVIGGEIIGELLVGYWGEASYTWEEAIDYSKFTIGLDYTFPKMIYVMAEYFFDGSGEDDPANYDYTKISSGERQTLAQHYLYASIGLSSNPFLRPSLNSIINLNDGGLFIIPHLLYSIFENTELSLGINYSLGTEDSEFRNITPYRGAVYVWAKVYF